MGTAAMSKQTLRCVATINNNTNYVPL
jgi:hypothetical protein